MHASKERVADIVAEADSPGYWVRWGGSGKWAKQQRQSQRSFLQGLNRKETEEDGYRQGSRGRQAGKNVRRGVPLFKLAVTAQLHSAS